MITVSDISELMQQCVELGYTFMFSKSGIPEHYNVHCAYMNNKWQNQSVSLSFKSDKEIIYRPASTESGYKEFSNINDTLQYITEQIGEPA